MQADEFTCIHKECLTSGQHVPGCEHWTVDAIYMVRDQRERHPPMQQPEPTADPLERVSQAITSLLQNNPHQWSSRPCPTCRSITGIIQRPFGCYEYQRRIEAGEPKYGGKA